MLTPRDADEYPTDVMGAGLLADMPPTTDEKADPVPDWDIICEHLESTYTALVSWRWSWWAHWSRLAEFILPRRYVWLVTANRMNKGSPINDAIVDSTGTLAMQTCASGMWSGLTNPARDWFSLTTAFEMSIDVESKRWLEWLEKLLYVILSKSNFYEVMAQAFEDLSTFGTAPVVIFEDADDVVRFYLPAVGEYYLAVGSRLEVDTLYREYTMTVKQIVEQFDIVYCPTEVRELWAQGGGAQQTEFVVIHAIEPNFRLAGPREGQDVSVVSGDYAYREVYYLKGRQGTAPLSLKGFNEKPFAALRWATTSNDPYGRSPGMVALGDIKQLQLETRRKAEFIEKLVRPPMGADPSLRNEPSSIMPGNVTYTTTDGGRRGFWPLFEVQAAALAPMVQDIQEVKARIEKTFYVDVWMAISQMQGVQPRNELELSKRDLERLQKLGPVINLVENEISAMITRVIAILERRGMLPKMPKGLRNVPLKAQFTSIMRLAQVAAKAVAMKDVFSTAGFLSGVAKAGGIPDPVRILNLDEAMRDYCEAAGYPTNGLFTPAEVTAHDKMRAKIQQQQMMPALAMAGVNAAKSLGQADIGPGTALGALAGAGGGGGGP